MNRRNIVIYNPVRFTGEAWLPMLWAQAKTYYERNGKNIDKWQWQPSIADLYGDDFEKTKEVLLELKPDVFAISLYVWNYTIAHKVAAWVKQTWPNCLIVSGGPHQYFLHHANWFQTHPYIDASLPGSCYGEICFQEILDNFNNGKVNWNKVTDIYYPKGKSRTIFRSPLTMSNSEKRNYDYAWAAAHEQISELERFVGLAKQSHGNKTRILTILETTRGCPYGCTYCDWGGGINSSVLKKPSDIVKKDITAMCQLNIDYLYFADANFGIFGDRDVEIIKTLAKTRKQMLQNFTVGYGGFAKTENKLPYIQEILKTDIKNELSALGEIKISMQSLDRDVLKRIDRKNVDLDLQIDVLKSIKEIKKLPIYVELIYGLPGMTLDKFYHELDVLGSRKLSVQWYPWVLLPEAPAYDKQYRTAEGIDTVIKTVGWWWAENSNNWNEIVVGASTYTKDDYLEMILSSSLYKLFVQGGYLQDTIDWIEQKHNIPVGQIIKRIYNEHAGSWLILPKKQWHNEILTDTTTGCFIPINGTEIYLGLYFVALAYLYHSDFTIPLAAWLQNEYGVPERVITKDLDLAIHSKNFGTKKRSLITVDYTKEFYNFPSDLNTMLLMFVQFKYSGSTIRANRRFIF